MALKELNDFKEFEAVMQASPNPLSKVRSSQTDALLEGLFKLVRKKKRFERLDERQQRGIDDHREDRARFERMEQHLTEALRAVHQAKECLGDLFVNLLQ